MAMHEEVKCISKGLAVEKETQQLKEKVKAKRR
jgi:hypothetical protein